MQTQQQTARAQDIRLFTTPIHAILTNPQNEQQAVRLVATGDVPGHSPSYLCVDAEGQSSWESFTNVRIIDTNYLPVSADALRNIQSAQPAISGKERQTTTR
jgi:hypothetical protein